MKFYKRFPGDITIKTGDLTLVEFGAYDRLLDHYYAKEKPIDPTRVYTVARCQSASDRHAVDRVLSEYWTLTDAGWVQERADEVIAEALPRIEAAKANGKLGGRPKKAPKDPEKKPAGFPEETQIATQSCDLQKGSQSQTSSPSSKKISKASPSHPSAEGFDEFWLAWPKNERKQDKAKCLEHWQRHGVSALAATIIADVRAKRGTRKWVDGFIEAPLVYLRNKRWEDGNTEPADEDLGDWTASRSGVEGRGVALGLGKWDQDAFEHGRGEAFPAYEARVRRAVEQGEGVPA